MTTSSTALLMFSPKGAGPFNSPSWRLGAYAQLVEGGSNGPYWLYQDDDTDGTLFIPLDGMDVERLLSSIALMSAIASKDPNLLGLLLDTHNLSYQVRKMGIAPLWELSTNDVAHIFRFMRDRMQLGVTLLEVCSLVDKSVLEELDKNQVAHTVFISDQAGS